MRIIDKKNLKEKKIRHYKILIGYFGAYCSYCEAFPSSLQREHKIPQSKFKDKNKDESNFIKFEKPSFSINGYLVSDKDDKWNLLLSCSVCNQKKSDHFGNYQDYVWPDHDNTHLLFRYGKDGEPYVQESTHLSKYFDESQINQLKEKASKTLGLFKVKDHIIENFRLGRICYYRDFFYLLNKEFEKNNNEEKIKQYITSRMKFFPSDPAGKKHKGESGQVFIEGYFSFFYQLLVEESKLPDSIKKHILKILFEAFPGTQEECYTTTGMRLRPPVSF